MFLGSLKKPAASKAPPDLTDVTAPFREKILKKRVNQNPEPLESCMVCFKTKQDVAVNEDLVCRSCRGFFQRFVKRFEQKDTCDPERPACFKTRRFSIGTPTVLYCDLRTQSDSRLMCQPCRYVACVRAGLKPPSERNSRGPRPRTTPTHRNRHRVAVASDSSHVVNSKSFQRATDPTHQQPNPRAVLLKRKDDVSRPLLSPWSERCSQAWERQVGPYLRAKAVQQFAAASAASKSMKVQSAAHSSAAATAGTVILNKNASSPQTTVIRTVRPAPVPDLVKINQRKTSLLMEKIELCKRQKAARAAHNRTRYYEEKKKRQERLQELRAEEQQQALQHAAGGKHFVLPQLHRYWDVPGGEPRAAAAKRAREKTVNRRTQNGQDIQVVIEDRTAPPQDIKQFVVEYCPDGSISLNGVEMTPKNVAREESKTVDPNEIGNENVEPVETWDLPVIPSEEGLTGPEQDPTTDSAAVLQVPLLPAQVAMTDTFSQLQTNQKLEVGLNTNLSQFGTQGGERDLERNLHLTNCAPELQFPLPAAPVATEDTFTYLPTNQKFEVGLNTNSSQFVNPDNDLSPNLHMNHSTAILQVPLPPVPVATEDTLAHLPTNQKFELELNTNLSQFENPLGEKDLASNLHMNPSAAVLQDFFLPNLLSSDELSNPLSAFWGFDTTQAAALIAANSGLPPEDSPFRPSPLPPLNPEAGGPQFSVHETFSPLLMTAADNSFSPFRFLSNITSNELLLNAQEESNEMSAKLAHLEALDI